MTQASGHRSTLPSTSGATVNTFTPTVVSSDETSPFDTTQGTVYLALGGGGTNKRDNTYGADLANVTTFTQIRTGSTKPPADATEPAAWSAKTDTTDAYGIAYFSSTRAAQGGNTTITVTYYHAGTQPTPATTPPAELRRVRDVPARPGPRSDGPPASTPEFECRHSWWVAPLWPPAPCSSSSTGAPSGPPTGRRSGTTPSL